MLGDQRRYWIVLGRVVLTETVLSVSPGLVVRLRSSNSFGVERGFQSFLVSLFVVLSKLYGCA